MRVEQPRDDASAADEDEGRRAAATLTAASAERQRPRLESPALPRAKSAGSMHEHEDGEEVLDDEPADGDVAGARVQVAVVRRGRG